MEGEINNLIMVWVAAIHSGCYCFSCSQQSGHPRRRRLLFLPVIALFTTLPFSLSSFHAGFFTFYLLTWLANSKLLLLTFGVGPLSRPDISLPYFLATLLLPVTFESPSPESTDSITQISLASFFVPYVGQYLADQLEYWAAKALGNAIFWAKLMGFALLIVPYRFKHVVPSVVLMGLHFAHFYVYLEMSLALIGAFVRASLGPDLRLSPQFNHPYFSTSLQDFWERRWNIGSSDMLKQTVHYPILRIGSPLIGKKPAMAVGVLATFLASGLMHELAYYCVTRVGPTWEVTWFFVFHGVCTIIEVIVKKEVPAGKWRLHRAISTPLTLGFLAVTAIWFLFPPLLGKKVYEKTTDEYLAVVDYLCKDKCSKLRSTLVDHLKAFVESILSWCWWLVVS